MPRAKRLVVIEDNTSHDDTPQIRNLLLHIRNTQLKLKNIFKDIPAGTPLKDLIKAFDELITSEILNYPIKKTFDSIESLNDRFNKLFEGFKNASQTLGMADTYSALCEALQLCIQWYRIQAIEAYLYKPLDSEFAVTESKAEAKVGLQNRFDILIQKINNFNLQVEEIEQGLEYYTLPTVNKKTTDLKTMLQPLLLEETRLNMLPNQAKTLEKLEKERLVLVKNLDDLRQEVERDVVAREESLINAQKERAKLYDSTLGIDVYYVAEFKKNHKEIFDTYTKLLMHSKQRDEFLRIDAIEKLIQHFSDPFRKYELSLKEYYTNHILNEYYTNHISTLYYSISFHLYNWMSSYYASLNGIYELLTQEFSAFKLNSAMLRLEAQYQQPYEYFRLDLPELEKSATENFVGAAKTYLKEVAALDDDHKALISSQAKEAFDTEVLSDTLKIRPSNFIPEIKSFIPKALKRDRLNNSWNDVFRHIFKTELQEIKSAFDALSGQPESDLVALKKMENRLKTKCEALDAILDSDQYPKVCEMFETIFLEASLDPIMAEVRARITHLEKSILPRLEEPTTSTMGLSVQPLEMKPQVREPAMPSVDVNNPSPWHARLTNKTWKRALIYGALTFVCVMLAFTVWGLIAEMSAGAIIMGGLGFSGLGFSVGAGTYYLSRKCCCKKTSNNTLEEDQPPMPNPVPRLVKVNHTNTDQKPSSPIVCQAKQNLFNSESMHGLGLFNHRPAVEMSESSLRKSSLRKSKTCFRP